MTQVLVVDDEPLVVEGIQALLALHGLGAVGARDREEAEALMANDFFPVVLADLRLRCEDEGLLLLDSVRRISPRSQVATITGYPDAATERLVRERGAQLVLYKPFDEEQLLAALREMLGAVESGPVEDLDELYAATLPALHAIAQKRYRLDRDMAEELIQETWLLFLEKRRSVRSPRSWLSGTIANLCRQQIERMIRFRSRAEAPASTSINPSYEEQIAIRDTLAGLDERSRTLLTMIGIEQHSYEEVSARCGLPLGSVGPLFIRAKKKARARLSN